MKKILVPTDFSPNADKALDFALHIARLNKGEIVLIHAAETYPVEEAILIAREKLALIRKSISETESIDITTEVYADSSINSIFDAIAHFEIDLIIMGTMGSAGVKEKIYGSRTAGVIGSSPVPVLAVPLLSEWHNPQKILLAINEFDEEQHLLNPVFTMASLFNASIQVTIFTDTNDDAVEDYQRNENKIAGYRDMLKTKYPELGIHAVHLAGHQFFESLQHWIEKEHIDIVTMLTHKRNPIESIFNKSKTKKMSYLTNIPLLAIPI